jgi:hypothetical protein
VHALYEAGYHAELNKRLKISRLPTLAGLHDIDLFAESAGTVTRARQRGRPRDNDRSGSGWSARPALIAQPART